MFSRKLQFCSPLSSNAKFIQDVLDEKKEAVQRKIFDEAKNVLRSNQNEQDYIDMVIDQFRVRLPHLDLDRITKSDSEEQGPPTEQFGRGIRITWWVVTFRVPYTGDIYLLQYLPLNVGVSMMHPEIGVEHGYIQFQVKSKITERNLEQMKADKEKILAFLRERLNVLGPEIEAYNNALPALVSSLFEKRKQQIRQNDDLLSHL